MRSKLTVLAPFLLSACHSLENGVPKVVLVTTDGFRWQEIFTGADQSLLEEKKGKKSYPVHLRESFWRSTPEARREVLLPFLWTVIARQGVIFGDPARGSPSRVLNGKQFSYPGYNEMLTGFADPRIDSNEKKPNPNVTVLEWLNRRPEFEGKVAAFCSWDVFPSILNVQRSGMFVNAGYEPMPEGSLTDRQELLNRLVREAKSPWDDSRPDAVTFHLALEYLKQRKPRVLYVSLDETDDWAHEGRYDRYLQAAHRFDEYLKELWQVLQCIPEYRNRTSLVVTSDHGRGHGLEKWRDHGKIEGAEFIWIAVMGPWTKIEGVIENSPSTQGQVAATLAKLLGEDFQTAFPSCAASLPGVEGPKRTNASY